MKTTNNTVLITGGSAGIGLEIAKQLLKQGNKIIITGRNESRLQKALQQLPGATAMVSDVADAASVDKLVKQVQHEFPELNMLINNAGHAVLHNISEEGAHLKAAEEMHTNYTAVIRLNEKLIPLLRQQPEAAIVNVTSIVAFAPGVRLATYAASKAALHSYSQALRLMLQKDSTIHVFELMPPLVNTEFSAEIGGANGIPPAQVAEELIHGLNTNTFEIHVGGTAQFYELFLSSPQKALEAMNQN